ncbi:YhcN/YlaJ family sporulation lipoprotein [Paenibacillus abyssi]|uniref:Lipoprotein YlaJ n=1 Tax=Paenibacillus abyssi TaxID=1340531 RepID=A0A917D683_9BACL|nr:YhcN/YlaJ family sporulation lipoprotein [Paenibacillus abyssi]GGG10405.1 putative lipoprotein YlaJ [Paenibacillus abyssi]
MFKRLLLTAAVCLILSGCGTVARNNTSPSPQNNEGVRVQQTNPPKMEIKNSKDVAAHLEELAKHIPGVNNANCVVVGNTAIVGIDVDQKLERSRVGTVKYSVAEAFRKDPYGVNAVVTADMDIAQRLREIRHDMANGRPVAGFAEELADIIGRIVPQMPRNTVPREEVDRPQMQKSQQSLQHGK